MKTTESNEMYLEIILKLEKRNGEVRSIDIAKELGYSKPSVSRGVSVLKNSGYIEHESYGNIILTEKGRAKASALLDRHNTITQFLRQTLYLDAETAEEDACRIEHIISQETADAIKAFVNKRPITKEL
ncbi:MAG: metal-dependent transcriptional regulator [Clostridiales bacterium]|nr:metal-dependent transcriptional regulator [Clostridiales bacterium]